MPMVPLLGDSMIWHGDSFLLVVLGQVMLQE